MVHSARYRRKITIRKRECLNESIVSDQLKGCYCHTYQCEKCGNKIVEYIYPMVSMFQHRTHCNFCGKQYELFPGVLLLQQYEEEFSKMLQKGQYAVWGMGETTQDYYYNNILFQKSQDLLLIDSNLSRQNIGFHGKKVISPDDDWVSRCDKILCCTSIENYHAICKNLRKNRLNTKKVVWLYQAILEK